MEIIKDNLDINRDKRHQKTAPKSIKRKNYRYSMTTFKNKKNNISKEKRNSLVTKQIINPISMTFRKYPNTLSLIKYIKLYKEMNIKNDKDKNKDSNKESIKKYIINKIINLLKLHRGFYNFFTFYQITEKAIIRLAKDLHFIQKEKNNYIWYENDPSTKINFLLKGKISFKKYVDTPYEREVYQENENHIFGMYDIVYDRKRKLSCMALEECSYLSFSKNIFKLYMEENVNKVISDRKKFLLKFFNDYLPLPPTKIERYVSDSVETLYFRKNEIIFKEGEKNMYLFLVFKGEVNFVRNINKNQFDILPSFNYSLTKLKENAKKIEYGKLIETCKKEIDNEKINNYDYIDRNESDIKNYKILCTLSRGGIAGMEITTGATRFKYNLICNSDFCAILKIKLELFDDEHLKVLMINLLPNFIDSEKKIYKIIQKIKFIDLHINPPSCRNFKDTQNLPTIVNNNENKTDANKLKYTNDNKIVNKTEPNLSLSNIAKNSNNLYISVNENESEKTYRRLIKRIDEQFDTNEGGFIKLTDYNLNLLNQKNFIKTKLIKSKRYDIKIKNFIKKNESSLSDIKASNVNMKYHLSEENLKNTENSFFNNYRKRLLTSKRNKSENKTKIKNWNFPTIKIFNFRNRHFINLFKMNFNSRKQRINQAKSKIKNELNEMIEKYEKAYLIKQSVRNIKKKEIYDKLVSFKLLNKDNKEKDLKKNSKSKNLNFIKEIIVMDKYYLKDKGMNTVNLSNRNNITDNEENKNSNSIKIVNNEYIADLFYNNLNNQFNNKKPKKRNYNLKMNFFNEEQFKKRRNYNKNRVILYDTGNFDMPLASKMASVIK